MKLTDKVHCDEVHWSHSWLEVLSFEFYCSSPVQLTSVAIGAMLLYVFFDTFPVI